MTEAPPKQPSTLCRSSEGRFLMGVCAGLGRHTGIDPVVFRVGFAILLFGSGIGLFLYIAAFLLMKEPRGGPGIVEQWTRRDFDADTVMALLTAVLAFGLVINLATVWLGTGTLVVGLLLVVSLLAAHTHGVDLLALARSMPERLSRRQSAEPASAPPAPPTPSFTAPTGPVMGAPDERMSDAVRAQRLAQAAEAIERAKAARAAEVERTLRGESPQVPTEQPPTHQPSAEQEPVTAHAAEAWPAETVPVTEQIPVEPAKAAERAEDVQHAEGWEAGRDVPVEDVSRTRVDEPLPKTRVNQTPPPLYAAEAPPSGRSAGLPYGEPFSPHGPYQPLDPRRRAGYTSPYDPALYGRPVPPPKPRRARSFIGAITFLLALIVGGIVVAVQAKSASGVQPTLVGGAVLITIGAGLLVAAWWGRGAGLVATGTTVALVIGIGLMFGGLPRTVGDSMWTPRSMAETSRLFDVGVGDGRLDLTELAVGPGALATVNASVSIGELTVIVPPDMRVEVHASNRVGDIKVDQSLRGGVKVKFDKTLEPETTPKGAVSTIVLNLKGGVGDMEVRRGA
ncbi:PspC domain-containing protein [Nonomuraea sp. NPDC050536]|uniref:PspC domain-containing protein n=1 Tax=Nonomuraea sp. NPDC050536 TaxID=3364366 RepID=UPI0037CA8F4E